MKDSHLLFFASFAWRTLSAVDPERMKQTIEMVAKTFNIPAPDPASVYRPDFLPPRAELQLQ